MDQSAKQEAKPPWQSKQQQELDYEQEDLDYGDEDGWIEEELGL